MASAWLSIASVISPFVVSGTGQITIVFVALAGGLIVALFGIESRNKVLEEFSP